MVHVDVPVLQHVRHQVGKQLVAIGSAHIEKDVEFLRAQEDAGPTGFGVHDERRVHHGWVRADRGRGAGPGTLVLGGGRWSHASPERTRLGLFHWTVAQGRSPLQSDQALLHFRGQVVVGASGVGEQGLAARRGHLDQPEHGALGDVWCVRGIAVPGDGAHQQVGVVVDVGPRSLATHLHEERMLLGPHLCHRMLLELPEAATDGQVAIDTVHVAKQENAVLQPGRVQLRLHGRIEVGPVGSWGQTDDLTPDGERSDGQPGISHRWPPP